MELTSLESANKLIYYLEADNAAYQTAIQDVLWPCIAMSEITSLVSEMLMDNVNYVKKNGMTKSAKNSRDRLLKLLDITETINKIASTNNTLKLCNESILRENQKLKNELNEIKRQENLASSL